MLHKTHVRLYKGFVRQAYRIRSGRVTVADQRQNSKWLCVHQRAGHSSSSLRSKVWKLTAELLVSLCQKAEESVGRMKSVRQKAVGTGDQCPKVMAKTGGPLKKEKSPFLLFCSAQATSLLVGATHMWMVFPQFAGLCVSPLQTHPELTNLLRGSYSGQVDISQLTITNALENTKTQSPMENIQILRDEVKKRFFILNFKWVEQN